VIVTIGMLIMSTFFIWKGSDWITESIAPLAKKLGTSYIAITTLVVSFMLSMPELFSTVYSHLLGVPTLGIGVIIGSVILNLGLTVGVSAAIRPLVVEEDIVIRDGIYLIVVAMIILVFGMDLKYERSEGITLLLLFIPYALNVWFFEQARMKKEEKVKDLKETLLMLNGPLPLVLKPSPLTFLIGAGILGLGSYMFSVSLVALSEALPFPKIIIGMIFGALGTGTPNIATAIQGTLKGYEDAAITETFGSNIFTLLITLGVLIVLNPIKIPAKLFYFDMIWMIVIHALMLSFIFKGYLYREESMARLEGIVLILFYVGLMVTNLFIF